MGTEFLSIFKTELRIKHDVSAQELTTFGVGHPIGFLIEPCNVQVLSELIKLLREKGMPWRILGAGSNLLLPDRKLEDIIIRFGREFSKYVLLTPEQQELLENDFNSQLTTSLRAQRSNPGELNATFAELFRNNKPQTFSPGEEVSVLALAGTPLMQLSRELSQLGYAGLEFAAGIPASLGGAVKMNAGAHGSAMQEVVDQVFVIDGLGQIQRLTKPELSFSYRHTAIDEQMIIFAVVLRLIVKDKDEVLNFRRRCLDYRKQTQPLHLPSAGSVFRNPQLEQRAAAKLLEEVGMKGQKRGGVCYSPMHSNWLVRVEESANVDDVTGLIELGRESVERRFEVRLEPEIVIW